MSGRLTPCPGCARHVKQGDCTCPFCGGKVACASQPTRVVDGPMSRSALFAASAVGVVIATTDCSGPSLAQPYGRPPPFDYPDAGQSGDSAVPRVDGASPADAGDAATGDGSALTPDAAAMPDAGDAATGDGAVPKSDAAAMPDANDAGFMPVPLYGGFIPVDASGSTDGNKGD
jgi:hypothetical protein